MKEKRGNRIIGMTFGLAVTLCWLLGQGVGLGAIGEEFLIAAGSSEQHDPTVAYDSTNQRFLVIYSEDIWKGQLLNADGTRWGPSFAISNGADCCQRFNTVAYDSINHRFLVVWMQGGPISSTDIWGQIVNADGTLLGTQFAILKNGSHHETPSVAYDPASQSFLVVWEDGRTPSFDIYGQRVGADGHLIGTEVAIATGPGSEVNPAGGYDSANQRFLVVYYDDGQLSGQLVGADGSLMGTKFQILSGVTCCENRSAVAYDSIHRRFLVARSAASGGGLIPTWDIQGQLVNADGTLFGSPFFLSATGGLRGSSVSAVYNPTNGRFLVVWGDDESARTWGSGGDLYSRQVNADGTLFPDREVPLATARPVRRMPYIAYDSANQRLLAVWEDYRKDSDIYGLLLTGLPVRPMASLTLNAASFHPGDPLNLDLRLLTPPHTPPAGNWSFEVAYWLKTPLDFPSDLLSFLNIGGPGNQIILPPGFNQTIPLLHLPVLPSIPTGSYKFGIRFNHTITREEFSLDEASFEVLSP